MAVSNLILLYAILNIRALKPLPHKLNLSILSVIKIACNMELSYYNKRVSLPNPYQISSWIIMTLNITFSYALTTKLLPGAYNLCFLVLYTSTLGILIIISTYISFSDPTTDSIKLSHEYRNKGLTLDYTKYPVVCTVCDGYVERTTKHCFPCNKCTEKFDHHCKWLNNCIGSKNYRYFIILILTCAIHFTIETIFNLILIAFYISDGSNFKEKCDEKLHVRYEVILVLLIMCIAQSFVVCLSFYYLIGFHIYLAKEGLTTYDFIMRKREIITPTQPPKIETNKDCSIFEQNSPYDLEKTQGNKTHVQSDTSLQFIEKVCE
ncbi:unnamed protein product [Blepharisma stoltei]|uniref:Palmitoyltransferase n=1 Tax=Blepharisma stoltei TaxID=1481888 RepID=A0AAU9JBX8_9CILI|nr:unnamed protein product [Blepharisma stoltei]